MLWRIVKVSVGRFYDYLGKSVWMNLLWFFLSLTVVLFPPATAALFRCAGELVRFEEPDAGRFLAALRRFFARAWALFLCQALVGLGLVLAIRIYLERMTAVLGQVAVVLGIICLWMLLYFLAILAPMWFFLVHQDVGVWTAVKRAALLFFLRPLTTFVLFVLTLLLFGLNIPFAGLPLACFQMSLVALLWNAALLVILDELPE